MVVKQELPLLGVVAILLVSTVSWNTVSGISDGDHGAVVYFTGDSEVVIVSAGGGRGDGGGGLGEGSEGRNRGGWYRGTTGRRQFFHPSMRYENVPCSVDEETCNIEELFCRSDEDCEGAFPNLQLAIDLGKDSTVPSLPFCSNGVATTSPHAEGINGSCSCGKGGCVSYSKQFGHDTKFYYCGPCGYVGSECRNKSCTHAMAECVDSFCECSGGGVFYEFSFCDIPFMGYETALQIVIIICIVIACCMIIASLYSIFGRRLPGRVPRLLLRRWRQEGTQESPERDAPPSYDEVADKLPTYQDALRMTTLVNPDGVSNLFFEVDDPLTRSFRFSNGREEDEMREGEERANEEDDQSHLRYNRGVTIAEVNEGVSGKNRPREDDDSAQMMISHSPEVEESAIGFITHSSSRDSPKVHRSTEIVTTVSNSSKDHLVTDSMQVNQPSAISPSDWLQADQSFVRSVTDSMVARQPDVSQTIRFQPIETPLLQAIRHPNCI